MKNKFASVFITLLPFILLQSASITLKYLDKCERQAELKARADACARDYANMIVFKKYQENLISGMEEMKSEWEFAYMAHHLEKH